VRWSVMSKLVFQQITGLRYRAGRTLVELVAEGDEENRGRRASNEVGCIFWFSRGVPRGVAGDE
jgi:hypothetical protein